METIWSVSLVETFRRPLVIGYVASDFPILSGGKWAPVLTLSVLEGHCLQAAKPIEYQGCDENCGRMRPRGQAGDESEKAGSVAGKEWRRDCIADFFTGDYARLRQHAVTDLIEAP